MPNAHISAIGEAMPRHKIERAIDRLIAILDALDGDPDLESSLGWTDRIQQCGSGWFGDNDPHGLDREFDPADDCGDDTADLEPEDAEPWHVPLHLADLAGVA